MYETLILILEEIFNYFNPKPNKEDKSLEPHFPFNGFNNYAELEKKVIELSYHTACVDTFTSLINERIGGLRYITQQGKEACLHFERDIKIYLTNHKLIF